MKNHLFLFIFFLVISCTNNNNVYWCGDHPCINKKEKEAYFKKTMIVEVKDLKKKTYRNKSEIEKLLQQAQTNEKKRIKNERELAKQAKLEEKSRIEEEKKLAKQIKLEEKSRIKEEKKLAKEIKLEEKERAEEEKKIVKKRNKIPKKSVELDVNIGKVKIDLNKFSELVEKITEQNRLRPYPNINDIPN